MDDDVCTVPRTGGARLTDDRTDDCTEDACEDDATRDGTEDDAAVSSAGTPAAERGFS